MSILHRFVRRSLPTAALILGISTEGSFASPSPESRTDDWQQRRLFEPTKQELRAEAKGRVVIYDGMKDTEVTEALDSQFHRVESMMFIRTKVTAPSGEVIGEVDEGC